LAGPQSPSGQSSQVKEKRDFPTTPLLFFFLYYLWCFGTTPYCPESEKHTLSLPLSFDAKVTGRRSQATYIAEFFNLVGKARYSLLPNSRFMEIRYVVARTHMHIPYMHLFIHTVCARCEGLVGLLNELLGKPCGVCTTPLHRRFKIVNCGCPLALISQKWLFLKI